MIELFLLDAYFSGNDFLVLRFLWGGPVIDFYFKMTFWGGGDYMYVRYILKQGLIRASLGMHLFPAKMGAE